jgi:hypothetical protein
MATVKIDQDVRFALLITIGDEDHDGKIGAKLRVYADVPFDGTAEPMELLDLPEFEPVDTKDIEKVLGEVMKYAGPVVSGAFGMFGKK